MPQRRESNHVLNERFFASAYREIVEESIVSLTT